jgi:peptidoglycan hydrolase CwlO-like protein
MRILAVSVLVALGLCACDVEHKVTISSKECDKLEGAEYKACMERLENAIDEVSKEVEEAAERVDKAAEEIDRAGDEIGERMERVGEAMRSSEPAPPPAPRP